MLSLTEEEEENLRKSIKHYSIPESFYECGFCLEVLSNPIVQTACGHRFCEGCLLKESSPILCPIDGATIYIKQTFADLAFQRQIAAVIALCPLSSHGCSWSGPIQAIKDHSSECFTKIRCKQVSGNSILQGNLSRHESKTSQLVKCKTCSVEMNAEQDKSHECPLESRAGPEGQPARNGSISTEGVVPSDSHLGDSLKLCKFSRLGCEFKGNRFELDLHMDIASEKHLEILAKAIQDIKSDYIKKENKIIAKHDHKIKLLHEYVCKQNLIIKNLQETNANLEAQLRKDHERMREQVALTDILADDVSRVQDELELVRQELREMREANYSGSLLWKIEGVSEKMESATSRRTMSIYSQSFYTSRYGYRLRAQLFLNGIGSSEGEYMSIYFHVLPSEHDDILSWPFNKKITFVLLELCDDDEKPNNVCYTLVPSSTSTNFRRPSEKMNDGRGHNKFVSLEKLRNGKYIKNDCMYIKLRVHCKAANGKAESDISTY